MSVLLKSGSARHSAPRRAHASGAYKKGLKSGQPDAEQCAARRRIRIDSRRGRRGLMKAGDRHRCPIKRRPHKRHGYNRVHGTRYGPRWNNRRLRMTSAMRIGCVEDADLSPLTRRRGRQIGFNRAAPAITGAAILAGTAAHLIHAVAMAASVRARTAGGLRIARPGVCREEQKQNKASDHRFKVSQSAQYECRIEHALYPPDMKMNTCMRRAATAGERSQRLRSWPKLDWQIAVNSYGFPQKAAEKSDPNIKSHNNNLFESKTNIRRWHGYCFLLGERAVASAGEDRSFNRRTRFAGGLGCDGMVRRSLEWFAERPPH